MRVKFSNKRNSSKRTNLHNLKNREITLIKKVKIKIMSNLN